MQKNRKSELMTKKLVSRIRSDISDTKKSRTAIGRCNAGLLYFKQRDYINLSSQEPKHQAQRHRRRAVRI